MDPGRPSRRDTLRIVGSVLAGLGGCSTLESGGADTPTPTATARDYSNRVDAPDWTAVRSPSGQPAVRSSAHSATEDLFESSARWDYEHWIVTSSRERAALNFTGGVQGVDAAREFIDGTDLARGTLLVHQYNVGECETRRPTKLEWRTRFARGAESYVNVALAYQQEQTADCPEDATSNPSPPYSEGSHDSEAVFVRIPTAEIGTLAGFSHEY